MSADAITRLLPVLMHIQANLDQDLSLEVLARHVCLSPFHFHRLFRATVGETLKQYTQRLRLERAANRLVIDQATILDIALDSGFQSHETFSRQFKRRFLVTPRSYRQWGRGRLEPRSPAALIEGHDGFELSRTTITRLAELHLAFIRHVGPYEEVSDGLWSRLVKWSKSRRLPDDLVFLGLAHDAPGVTAPDRLRFDAAIVVSEPFSSQGEVGHQVLAAAEFAVTTHIGHYRTLPDAYVAIVQRIVRMKTHRLGGLPSIEIYRTTRVDANHEMNQTDIYIPVRRVRK